MKTTSIIVEMLIIGFFGGIWIILFISKYSSLNLINFINDYPEIKNWSALIALLAILVLYQLGWVINWISVILISFIANKKIRDPIFLDENTSYISARTIVYQAWFKRISC